MIGRDTIDLNLSGCGLNIQSIRPLVKALKKHPSVVEVLDISQNAFVKDTSIALLNEILPSMVNLKWLR